MDQTFMKEKPIFPLLLSMSIPNVLSMLVNALYNIVDSWFVARYCEDAMTSLSLVFPIQNVSLAIAVGFSVGMNAVIALLLGMKDEERAGTAGSVGLVLCAVHGLLLTVGCIAVMPYFLRLFSNDQNIIDMAMEYSVVLFLFSVPHHLYIGMEKIYQSVGRMKTSMAVMMVGCITNVILDPLFIFGWGPIPSMGIAGAALASGIGQTAAMIIYFVIYHLHPVTVRLSRKCLRFDRRVISKLYAIGIPSSLNIALPSLLISALNGILAAYSDVYILALGIYYKLQTFVYMPANGIVQGLRPLVGYNYGAREYDRVKKLHRTALGMTAAMMLLGSAICLIFPRQLIGMFSTTETTIDAGAAALTVISLGFLASAVSIAACGTLEGLGKGVHSLGIALLRNVIIIIPLAFILSRFFGVMGVWHSFWITELVTAFIAYPLCRRVYRKKQDQFTA